MVKSYMLVLESSAAMEGSTSTENTECYFLFYAGKESTPEEIESTPAQEGSTLAFIESTPKLLTDSNG